jgi:hypothetical protein
MRREDKKAVEERDVVVFSALFVIRAYVIHTCAKITSLPVHEAFSVTGREVYYNKENAPFLRVLFSKI